MRLLGFGGGLLVDLQEVDLKTEDALKTTTEVEGKAALEPETTPMGQGGGVKRKTLAGMLSEALCSHIRRVSEQRLGSIPILRHMREVGSVHLSSTPPITERGASIREDLPGDNDEIPFARRAREAGRKFTGEKKDGKLLWFFLKFRFFLLLLSHLEPSLPLSLQVFFSFSLFEASLFLLFFSLPIRLLPFTFSLL